jgi:hypothetical protein
LKVGWGKFCSQKCQFQSQRNGTNVKRAACGELVYRTPKHFKHSKSKLFFCNKSCLAAWKNKNLIIGEKHASWKSGEYAYRNIIKRSKVPQFCKNCGEKDFRVLLVHHIDGDRKNNDLKDLMWLCHNCHFLKHVHNIEVKG